MCGFIGYTGNEIYATRQIAQRTGELIRHRGPDSDGVYIDGGTALSFRRLSIIDLDGGDQPMSSECGRYTIVFNGEIYNYRELRHKLIDEHGCIFRTNSDTEVILQMYSVYGSETASYLRGMFAFAIWDSEKRTFYGARDPFGIKPFFWTLCDGNFIFGSEIKGFLAHPAFKKEINPEALKLYLQFQYSPLNETFFKGVFRLDSGCYFTYDEGGMHIERYFEPKYDPVKRSFANAVELIDETVRSSVEYHQIADVEVGSFLSGGVDSSYVASVVSPMKTYSVGFAVDGFDETSMAADLSKMLGMENIRREITPDDFFAALPAVQYHSDEPHANLSAVPLYYLAELASRDLKVVLSGEGADELFGGYDWYIESDAARIYKKLPLKLRKTLAKTFGRFPQRHIARFFRSGAERVEDNYIGQAFIMGDSLANEILSEKYRSDISFRDVTRPYYDNVKDCDDLTKKLYLDMKLWLPGDILLKADRMTMAHSLELRVPYLDKEVFKVAASLTSSQKMKGRHTKRAFRAAADKHIPSEWSKRKKAGFMVPFRVWIKQDKYAEMVEKALTSEWAREFFDTEKLLAMLHEHREGKANNARVLYTVYSFLIWYEQYFIIR